jgi:hypothetical protein
VLGRIEFGGIRGFVGVLADLIDELGLSDPPALEAPCRSARRWPVDFGVVAHGCVEAMGGVVFTYDRFAHIARLTGFLQVRGEVNVLSLINVSVTLLLELTYDFNSDILSGHAEVVVELSVWFFSQSVTVPYDWATKGGNADPTFAELMDPEGTPASVPGTPTA